MGLEAAMLAVNHCRARPSGNSLVNNYHCNRRADLLTMAQRALDVFPQCPVLTPQDHSFPVFQAGSEVVHEMPELIRSIVSRLRELAGDRRHAYRHQVRLVFTVSIHPPTGHANGRRPVPSIQGYTRDISSSGLALIVPAIRIGEHYLTGEDRRLKVVLELPTDPIEIIVTPVRYEPLDDLEDEQGFLIGVRITEMSSKDREDYNSYIKSR